MVNGWEDLPSITVTTTNPSVGTNNTPAPSSSNEIGFIDGSGNLQGVSTTNPLPVDIHFDTVTVSENLAQVNGATVNVGTGADSTGTQRVAVSSTSIASLATGAKQDTGNTSLASIDGKLTAPLSVTGPLTDTQLRASAVPVSAAALPLPAGASTSALQTTGNTSLSSIDGKLNSLGQKAMAASVPVAIASDQSAIPVSGTIAVTGVSTAVNQTNGSQITQVIDPGGTNKLAIGSSGNVLVSGLAAVGAAPVLNPITVSGVDQAGNKQYLKQVTGTNALVVDGSAVTQPISGSVTAALPSDLMPATQNITTQDLASTSTSQANGQVAVTGNPTANSAASFSVSSENSFDVQVTGTWTGTLINEVSIDSGVTWYARGVKQTGSSYISNSFTQNYEASGNITGVTNLRVRATTAITGTATVKITLSLNPYAAIITNPLTLRDATVQSISNTIKAASTAPLITDTAIVVADVTQGSAGTGGVGGTAGARSALVGSIYNQSGGSGISGISLASGQQASIQADQYGSINIDLPDWTVTGASAQTVTGTNVLNAGSGVTTSFDVSNFKSGCVQVVSTGTGGTFIFECSNDNANFATMPVFNQLTTSGTVLAVAISATASAIVYTFPIQARYIRLRIASTITGGSIQAFTRISQSPWTPTVFQVAQSTAASLATTTSLSAGGIVASTLNTLVADVASGTIVATTNSATITPGFGANYQVNIAVTAGTFVSDTYSFAIQESSDTATNWYTVYTFPNINAIGTYNSPILAQSGNRIRYVQTVAGGAASITRAINRIQINGSSALPYKNLIDSAINPTSTNSVTSALFCEGNNTYSAIVNQGAGGSGVNFAMDGSDDNQNWVSAIATCTGVIGGASPVAMFYSGANYRFIRVRVVTGVAATTIVNVSISSSMASHDATALVSGTVTANIGTSGSLALDASVTGLQVSQGSTTSGQKGGLSLGAVTTASPSYTTAQSSPLSLDTTGNLRTVGAISAGKGTLANQSGSSSTSSGTLMAANAARKYLFIQNIDSAITQYINFTSAADVSANSIALLPFATFSLDGSYITTEQINIISASGTPKYIAKEG